MTFPRSQRLDLSDPKVAADMMSNGMFWTGGPATSQMGVDMLVEGRVAPTRQIISNLPQGFIEGIDKKRRANGDKPLAEVLRLSEDDGA